MIPEEKKEKRRAYLREWYQRNLEANRASGRIRSAASYKRHQEARTASARQWKTENADRVKASRKAHYASNREKAIADAKAAYWADPEAKRAQAREYIKQSGPVIAERKRVKRHKNPAHTLWESCKRTALRCNLPFSIEIEDIVIPACCPVFGFPLVRNEKNAKDTSPSVDKIIPALGYVPGNIAVVSWKANRLKSNASIDELRKLAAFYTNLEQA